MFMWLDTHATAYMWRSKDNFKKTALPIYNVGTGDQIQVIGLESKCLYMPDHLAILQQNFTIVRY